MIIVVDKTLKTGHFRKSVFQYVNDITSKIKGICYTMVCILIVHERSMWQKLGFLSVILLEGDGDLRGRGILLVRSWLC